MASVRVNYTVSYLLPGSSIPSNDVTFTFPGFIVIANGSTNSTIEVAISESSFLRSDGAFLVTLISAHIESKCGQLSQISLVYVYLSQNLLCQDCKVLAC